MTLQQADGAWSAAQVRDTVAAIAQQPAFQRDAGRSLWDRFWDRVFSWLGDAMDLFSGSVATRWIIIALLVLLVLLIVARIVIVLRTQRDLAGSEGARRGPASSDPWLDAERLAAAGRYTEAAHALLAAVLRALAARGEVRLHDSKTTGDYARELERTKSSARPAFRAFRTRYDLLIYGKGECTAEEFAALRREAEPAMARPRAA